jgi:hypothetical protein
MIVLSPDALTDIERLRTFLDQVNPGAARHVHDVAILSVALSGRFQPLDFRLELEAQLRTLVVGQPVRHLRKDRSIKQDCARFPRKLLSCAGFCENLVEFGAHGVRVSPVFGRRCILAEQVGLSVSLEKVALSGRGHVPRFGCRIV